MTPQDLNRRKTPAVPGMVEEFIAQEILPGNAGIRA